MKIRLLIPFAMMLFFILSCSLLFPRQNMFEPNNLQKAFAAFQEKKGGNLSEIEVSNGEVYFNIGFKKFVYSRGFLRETEFKYPSATKDFLISEVDLSNLEKAMSAAIELAKKNPYMDKTVVSRIIINKQTVNRDDNLVSNIDKWHDAIRFDIYVADSDGEVKYSTNLQGQIIDVAATNVKPRLKFLDSNQMQKSLAEIKPLFGGKLSVADFTIHIEDFSFKASDPNNLNETNIYRFNSQEFLQADSGQNFLHGPFFDLDEIDFSLIPKVMQKTLENGGSSGAKVSEIDIRKTVDKFKNTAEIEWRVTVAGDRWEKRTVIFDNQGNSKN